MDRGAEVTHLGATACGAEVQALIHLGTTDLGAERASFAPRPLSFPERDCIVLPSFSGFSPPQLAQPSNSSYLTVKTLISSVDRQEQDIISHLLNLCISLVYCTCILEIRNLGSIVHSH